MMLTPKLVFSLMAKSLLVSLDRKTAFQLLQTLPQAFWQTDVIWHFMTIASFCLWLVKHLGSSCCLSNVTLLKLVALSQLSLVFGDLNYSMHDQFLRIFCSSKLTVALNRYGSDLIVHHCVSIFCFLFFKYFSAFDYSFTLRCNFCHNIDSIKQVSLDSEHVIKLNICGAISVILWSRLSAQ